MGMGHAVDVPAVHGASRGQGPVKAQDYVRGADGLVHTGCKLTYSGDAYRVVACTFSAICDDVAPTPMTCLWCVVYGRSAYGWR